MNKKLITILLLTLSLAFAFNNRGSADEPSSVTVAPGDQVWLVSARDYDACHCPSSEFLHCQQFCEIQGCWNPSSCSLLANSNSSENVETVVFVHGYQTDLEDAQKRGLQVYQNLFGCGRCSGPIRFVIWAWRSEKECRRPVVDFNMKAKRAAGLGDIFAMTMNELGPRAPIVVGYSLGAQVAVAGMAKSSMYHGQPIRLAVIAAANDCGFASCCNQMNVCGNIEQSLIFLNESDRAIKAANLICKLKHGQQFRSFDELAVRNSNHLGQINIVDITEVATAKHSIVRYTALPVIKSCIDQFVLENSIRSTVQAIQVGDSHALSESQRQTLTPSAVKPQPSNAQDHWEVFTGAKARD